MARGLHSIRGTTAPHHDLMVWRNETTRAYDVTLPDGPRHVEVVLLRDFESHGWEGFATCDRSYAGGWAEKDRLYCAADSYDLSSETFSVSYLAHETQHFADYERFPKLVEPELEYRAKLVELMMSRQITRTLVALFATQTGETRDAPHNYANGKLAAGLARRVGADAKAPRWWQAVSDERFREAARELFDDSTRALEAPERGGAKEVTQFL